MPISIKTCISNNSQLLGVDFINLGQTKYSLWGGHKILLSYNNQSGWKICKLNIFQRFVRYYFGMYKETRFEHVYEAWRKEKKLCSDLKKNHPLNVRINSIWKKCNFAMHGNSSLADAHIICLGDIHTNDEFRHKYHKIIKAHYQPGDLILIEGIESEIVYQREKVDHNIQNIDSNLNILKHINNLINRVQCYFSPPEKLEQKPKEVNCLVKNLKGNYNIQGWEPIGRKYLKEVFGRTDEKMAQVRTLHDEIIAHIPLKGNFTEKDLEPLMQACKKFENESNDLGMYFQMNAVGMSKYVDKELQKLVNITIKETTLEEKELKLATFKYCIHYVLQDFEKWELKARYAHVDPKMIKNLDEAYTKRNKVMCEEIEKALLLGKKVFVIGGSNHFLAYSKESAKALFATKDFLNKSPYVIVSKKDLYQRKYAKHNPELKKVN